MYFATDVIEMSSGSFETTTRTKIKTAFGTVLKLTRYNPHGEPEVEYWARPKCTYCKTVTECLCYSEFDYYDALGRATELLQMGTVCENPQCVIKCALRCDPEWTELLIRKHGVDVYAIRDAIWEGTGMKGWDWDWDEGPSDCGF